MQNKHSLQQAKAVLSADIIARDQESFVYQGNTNRLHWEKNLPEGESCSSFLTKAPTVEDALKEAYRLASDMLSAMCLPQPVEIEVSHQDDSSWTNSKLVHVTTNFFDNPNLTVGQMLDIFIGLTVHEGCHVLYTDFKATAGMSSFAAQLDNILEDEFIEHRCGDDMPGLSNFLKMAKWYYFGEYTQKYGNKAARQASLDEGTRLINAVIRLVRFRGALTDEDIESFSDALIEVHDCLVPYPTTSKAVAAKALEVEQILLKYLTAPQKPEQQQQGDGQEQDSGEDDGEGSKKQQTKNSSPSESGQDDGGQQEDGQKKSSGDSKSESGAGNDSDSDKSGQGQSTQPQDTEGNSNPMSGAGLTEREAHELLNKLAEQLKELSKDPDEPLSEEDECEAVKEDDTLNKRLTGKSEKAEGVYNTYFEKTVPSPMGDQIYQVATDEIRRFVPAMRNALRSHADENRRTLTGCRSGLMDTNLLAAAYQGVPNVYRQTQTVKADPITVCLVIDESGSMDCDEKSFSAMKTAVLLEQALNGINGVDLYVYGYTTQEHTDIHIFREKGYAPRKGLGQINAYCGTYTGAAILACAERIRRHTQNKCLMFVLTDGSSADSTRDAVEKVSNDGFIPVGIGIEAVDSFKTDFTDCIYLTDMSKLPQSLGQIVKKAIMQNSRRHVC